MLYETIKICLMLYIILYYKYCILSYKHSMVIFISPLFFISSKYNSFILKRIN